MLIFLPLIIFILFSVLFVYSYGGYKFALSFLTLFTKKRLDTDENYKPMVSILIPAHNEEDVIKQKIENSLNQDYPSELLEVMVCSDCSTDKTIEIAKEFGERISLYDYRERGGKTGILNRSIPKAKGEIVLLTDANTMIDPNAVSTFVKHYSSEKVGAVSGHVNLIIPGNDKNLKKEITYRKFESDLKHKESLLGATIGCYGGFYSIRKDLYIPLPDNAYSNDDLLTPMSIINRGYKVHFIREALAKEESGRTKEVEFNRRIRIGAGNYQSFFLLAKTLNVFNFIPFFLFFSHKILRWFSPFILLGMLLSNIALFSVQPFNYFLYAQILGYSLALVGFIFSKFNITLPVLSAATHFSYMNVALLLGFFRYMKGIKSAAWESPERDLQD